MYASQANEQLPMVPGLYRSPDGYLKGVLARSTRPGSAPAARRLNGASSATSLLNFTDYYSGGGAGLPTGTTPLARPGTAVGARHLAVGKKIPDFVTKEKEVLRFQAYFQEPVHEGGGVGSSGFRVRTFAMNYYLADETMSIEEPRVHNSGLTQGKFMRRTRVERPRTVGGGVYQPEDFCVGQELWVYGRRFRIVDADARTREWFRTNLNLEQGAAEKVPDDGYAQERQRFEAPKQREAGQLIVPGAVGTGAAAGAREKGEFYKKDRKVLRFFCRYEDRRLQGDKRDYVLYYYLLNDTVEVKEIPAEGRHNFPNLLRRQKLPKDSMHVPTAYGGVISPRDGEREKIRSITWEDLRCGEAISVYGRHLLMLSCDSSTAAWYAARGVHQRTVTIGHDEADERGDQAAPPPYNGFGNEDDLYAMGLSLEPMNKEVNQDEYERFLRGDKKVCRFRAKLANVDKDGTDASRDFVVNYFLADDTLSVFEPQVRNSGVIGGLFLARGRYKKYIPAVGQEAEGTRLSEKLTMDGGLMEARVGLGGQLSRWLRPTDFVPGSVVTFEMPQSGSKLFTLELVGHDEYTRKLLDDRAIFPQSFAQLAAARLAETLSSAKLAVRGVLRAAALAAEATANGSSSSSSVYANGGFAGDAAAAVSSSSGSTNGASSDGRGRLTAAAFAQAVEQLESAAAAAAPTASTGHMRLTPAEVSAIAREFAHSSNNSVLYDDFVDALVLASPRCAKLKDRTGGSLRVQERILRAMHAAYEDGAPGGGRLRAVFRARDAAGRGTVSPSEWVQVLRETKLNAVMTRQVAEALCLEHDTHADGSLDYNALCDDIFQGDFEGFNTNTTTASDSSEQRPETDSPPSTTAVPGLWLGGVRTGGSAPGGSAPGGAPPLTVRGCMRRMNEKVFTHGGDMSLQLARAMRSFSSAYARANRKKMIRKHLLAFDVGNTGRVSRAQFLETVDEVAAEFFMDFDKRDRDLLADFFFPRANCRVDYEELLDIINARDVRRAQTLLQRTLAEGCDYEEVFGVSDSAARTRDFGGTLNLFATNASS